MIRFRHEEGAGGQEPAAPQWAPSQEEWTRTQQAVQQLAQLVQPLMQPEEEELDPNDVDIDAYINQRVNQALAPMMPVFETSVKEAGTKELNSLHDRYEQEYGKFDRKMAEAFAQSAIGTPGVGNDARKAVEEGVKQAVAVRDQIKNEALEEYKAQLKRGPHDFEPAGGGGGDRRIPDAKTYDEVVAKYAGETEV